MVPYTAAGRIVEQIRTLPDFDRLWSDLGAVTRKILVGKITDIGWEVARKSITPRRAAEIIVNQVTNWGDWQAAWNALTAAQQESLQQTIVKLFQDLLRNPH